MAAATARPFTATISAAPRPSLDIEEVTEIPAIMFYGITQTPRLAVDG
jgi:hypothetical protein